MPFCFRIFLCFCCRQFYCGYGNAAASVFPVQGAGEKGALPEGHLESMGLWISGGFSGGRGSGHHQQCGFVAV